MTFTKKRNGGKIKDTAGTGRSDSLEILAKREKNWTDFSWDRTLQYKAGQCLQCGCCLEVCPNFLADKRFTGASAMVEAYRAIEQSSRDEHRDEMLKEYREKFFPYCGQSLSCKSVCPQQLPLDAIQARVNSHGRRKL